MTEEMVLLALGRDKIPFTINRVSSSKGDANSRVDLIEREPSNSSSEKELSLTLSAVREPIKFIGASAPVEERTTVAKEEADS